ncbi:MAG: single-stranded DNA-binding protein [Proteobacteria bacterium]|nr:single-stranded DNA-binding protein [Pseudomonadota bacterium]
MVNKAILIGRLGRDPECKTAQSGKLVCNFTLATDTGFGQSKTTDWHRIVCFDKQAEFCRNYLRKGSLIYVEGRISYRDYEKDGVKQKVTDIIASSIQSLQSRSESQGAAGNFDANAYDTPSYGGGSSYNSAPSQSYGGSSYNSAPAQQYNNAPAQPYNNAPADNFVDGIANEDIPF